MTKKLISRKALFGNPDIGNLSISPDGMHVAYLAEHKGVLNIWIHEFDKEETSLYHQS